MNIKVTAFTESIKLYYTYCLYRFDSDQVLNNLTQFKNHLDCVWINSLIKLMKVVKPSFLQQVCSRIGPRKLSFVLSDPVSNLV